MSKHRSTTKERRALLRRAARALERAERLLAAAGVYDPESERELCALVARAIAAARRGEWPQPLKRLYDPDTIH